MDNSKNSSLSKLIPVMLCFFAMGFVDLVGITSNYVKADLGLSDSQANIFPSLVFFWFLIFSVPTGMLMSRIGQKKTVLLSLLVTFASLLLPVFGDSYMLMLISFSLLGIGNALMQTSLNPLLSNIVRGDRLASSLTFGQFVKAIASFLAPYIAMWGATQAIPTFDLGWRQGEFIFDDLPLQEIARELSNSFGATIHIADTALQNYRITARFRNGEDLTTILSVLHNAGYFDYSQNNKQIIITAKPD